MRLSGDERLSDRRVTEWFLLEKARREGVGLAASKKPAVGPVITISRQFGAGGHTVAEKLVRVLGDDWTLWDKELIDAIAGSAQVRTEMVEALDERTHSWLTQMVRQLCSVPVMEPQSYRQHLVGVLLVLAQQGKKVVLGRGANFVLREALNVRLEASEGFRVHETMKREGIGHADALRQVHQVDLDRARFSRSVFQQDVDDRKTYDMVLRTDELGYDAAAAAIVGAARVMFGAQ